MRDAAQAVKLVQVELFGLSAVDVVKLANAHGAMKEPEFMKGFLRGQRLQSYALGQSEIQLDPDFPRAMQSARDSGLNELNDLAVPLAGLEQIWFTNYMERYL